MATRLDITGTIIEKQLPLAGILEEGTGLRIGKPGLAFSLAGEADGQAVFADADAGLEVRSRVTLRDQAVVVSSSLRNVGSRASKPIDVIEPLYLVFRHPCNQWRHVYALGGTTESCYPPLAYTTRQCARAADMALNIESHPELDFCHSVMVMLRGIGDPAAGFVILVVFFPDPRDRKAFQKLWRSKIVAAPSRWHPRRSVRF